MKTFYPLKQVYPKIKVWKTGDGRTDTDSGRNYISQTFYAEDETGNIESFDHSFYLQSYYREEWLAAFTECGFEVVGEYKNRNKEPWSEIDEWWIVEVIKASKGRVCSV